MTYLIGVKSGNRETCRRGSAEVKETNTKRNTQIPKLRGYKRVQLSGLENGRRKLV